MKYLVREEDGRKYIWLNLQNYNGRNPARCVSLAFGDARCGKYDLRRWCDSCLRWLEHRQGECPRLANPRARCVCDIHTCYDARALGIDDTPETAEVYRDFV